MSTESRTPGAIAGIEKPPPVAGAKRDYVHALGIRTYVQSSKSKTRALYIAALINDDSEFADELLRESPDSSEARLIDYLRNASWDPRQLEASYELALRLQAADPHSNLGSLLALGYKNFVPNTKETKAELLEQVLNRTPRVWPIGQKEILEATGMLLSAGYTTEEAKSVILERSSRTQANIAEVAKKGVGLALVELRTLHASGDEGKAINLVSGILPTLRQFEMAPTQDYQLVVFANGFESAMLKLLPQDASYGETGMSVATASEDLLNRSHALVSRYAAVEELVAKLPPDQQDIAKKIAAFEGPQKALEWLEMRFAAEHR